MGQAYDHDAVYSTKDGTVVMQAIVQQDPSSHFSYSVQGTCTVYRGPHLVPWAPYIRGTRGNAQPSLLRRLISPSSRELSPSSVALVV
jgi:hypothetical protein